jgi:hypothetical protein
MIFAAGQADNRVVLRLFGTYFSSCRARNRYIVCPGVSVKSGAILVMDVLGFKGIWERHSAAATLRAMRLFEKMVVGARRLTYEREGDDGWNSGTQEKFRFLFLSDTLIIACWEEGRRRHQMSREVAVGASVFFLCRLTSRLLSVAANMWFPFRGCITAGDFDILRSFVIGPAVDEAAEWADKADGAFVWLRPGAVSSYEIVARGFPDRHVIYPYDVPMKNSGCSRTAIINPMGDERRATSKRDLEGLLQYFDETKPGVKTKLENTRQFFDYVLSSDRYALRIDRRRKS